MFFWMPQTILKGIKASCNRFFIKWVNKKKEIEIFFIFATHTVKVITKMKLPKVPHANIDAMENKNIRQDGCWAT